MKWGYSGVLAILMAPMATFQAAQGQEASTAQTRVSGWVTQCISAARDEKSDCAVEQTIHLQESGQQLARVTVQVPGATRDPHLNIQLPHGIYIASGLRMQIDSTAPKKLEIRSCNASGCYASVPLSDNVLQSMIKGADLKLVFSDLNQAEITVTMPLSGFTSGYTKID